jgi:predicted kinase
VECVLFIGIQATGKSTFYKERFFQTHMHLNLDMLRTRNREQRFLQTCIESNMRFVVDNTNPSCKDRERYITLAKEHGFRVIGYYFQSKTSEAITRNRTRPTAEQVPERGIFGVAGQLELPNYEEGFDELWYVRIGNAGFVVEAWNDAL